MINTNINMSQAMLQTILTEQQRYFKQINSQLISQTQMMQLYPMDMVQQRHPLFLNLGIRRSPNAADFQGSIAHDQKIALDTPSSMLLNVGV